MFESLKRLEETQKKYIWCNQQPQPKKRDCSSDLFQSSAACPSMKPEQTEHFPSGLNSNGLKISSQLGQTWGPETLLRRASVSGSEEYLIRNFWPLFSCSTPSLSFTTTSPGFKLCTTRGLFLWKETIWSTSHPSGDLVYILPRVLQLRTYSKAFLSSL